jgi:hypothetical protein
MKQFDKIRHLYGIAADENNGFSEGEVAALEEQLGVQLPATLRDYYLSLGQYEALNYAHNTLLQPEEVAFSDDEYLVFYEENQAVAVWGIKKADLAQADPPVYGNYSTDENNPDWHQESTGTESFLLLMAVYNGVLGGLRYNGNHLDAVDAAVVAYVEANYEEQADASYGAQKVYTRGYDEVICLSFDQEGQCNGIFIGTNDEGRFDGLLETLDVEWDYLSTDDMDEEG